MTPAQLDRLVSDLVRPGYAVKVADGVLDRMATWAAGPSRGRPGSMRMFADPEVALVMPVTGGEGAGHLVDRLDYGLIAADPKLFTGFSDPSVLNNSLLAAAGLPSVHGVSGFQFFGRPGVDEPTRVFWGMVTGPIAGLEVPARGWRAHRTDGPGVSGPVVGGDAMGSVSALAGSRWMPSTAGAVVLLESVPRLLRGGRPPAHPPAAGGVFDDIAALVIGAPADWAAEDAPDTCTDELILRCVGGRFPVITGVEFGHQERKIQFPVGCRVEFDLGGSRPVLRYLEDLVTPRGVSPHPLAWPISHSTGAAAAVQRPHALAEVPRHHDPGAGQQPADPLGPARGPRARGVRPAGDDRPPHRAGPADAGRQRPGRRHLLAGRLPRDPGRLRPQPARPAPGPGQGGRRLAQRHGGRAAR